LILADDVPKSQKVFITVIASEARQCHET